MRESKKTEKMHLPRGSDEEWLETQKPGLHGSRPRNPPENVYEAWLEKRVERRTKRKSSSK
jgi:hypothetical protein